MSQADTRPAAVGDDSEFTLDEALLSRRKADSSRRLFTVQVPALRAAGFVVLCAILMVQAWREDLPLHDPKLLGLLAINLGYAALAWPALRLGYGRTGKLDPVLLLFHLDIVVWLPSLAHLEQANLFFGYFIVIRAADQVGFGFRRALYFGHVITLTYLLYAAWVAWLDPGRASWADRIGIAAGVYLLSTYIALTGLVIERLRRRARVAARHARTLVDSLAQTNRALKAQALELQHARQAAEQASRAKSQFLAVTSHEIRTPMNGILGAAELLISTPLDATQKHYVQLAHRSATALLALIDDVLDLSRIEAGRLTLRRESVDVRALVAETVDLARLAVGEKSLTLSFAVSPELPARVLADPLRLRQILLNLLQNAVKFSERGTVRLSVSSLDVAPPEATRQGAVCHWRFSIHDTGIGIARDHLAIIFEAFTQVDSSSTRRHGGTGLGLAVVRELTALMGGTVGVESELGRGSHFWIDLPLEAAETPPPMNEAEAAAGATDSCDGVAVLLVEDDPVNRMVAEQMLLNLGCAVEVVDDGEEARRAAAHASYDIVFMDCHMPVMDGYESTRCIRADERGKGRRTPIVALTADALATDRDRCLEAGMDGFLTKPVSSAQLSEAIERWTRRRTHPATRW